MYYAKKLNCIKNEQGNFCPYSLSNIQKFHNSNSLTDGEILTAYMKYFKESCKSKTCIDEISYYIEFIENAYLTNEKEKVEPEEKQFIQDISSLLKSETYTAQNENNNINSSDKTDNSNSKANDKTDVKSGATQITYSNVLFISLAILLSTLF